MTTWPEPPRLMVIPPDPVETSRSTGPLTFRVRSKPPSCAANPGDVKRHDTTIRTARRLSFISSSRESNFRWQYNCPRLRPGLGRIPKGGAPDLEGRRGSPGCCIAKLLQHDLLTFLQTVQHLSL